MKKTVRIDNWKDMHVGDMLFVSGRSDGFRVACVRPVSVSVDNPVGYGTACVSKRRFDHAERTVEESKWPYPSDLDLHVYLGADGAKYLYMPFYDGDATYWRRLPYYRNHGWHNAEEMTRCYPAALPLKELKYVPKEEEA